MRDFPFLFFVSFWHLYYCCFVYSIVFRGLVDREVKVNDLWRPFLPILTSTISTQLPKCVVSPISLFLYVRHFSYQIKSEIRDIAEQILKLTMNADKRNDILSALCSLRMISFFEKSEQKHLSNKEETPVKQGRNTCQTRKKHLSNKEEILDKSGIIFVFKTKFKYKHRIRIRTNIMQTKWIDDSRTQTPAKTGMRKMY